MNSPQMCAFPLFLAMLFDDGWAGWIIQWILNPAILVIVPLCILRITIIIVKNAYYAAKVTAWKEGTNIFFRVLAAALLPFITVVFIFDYQETLLLSIASIGGIYGFLISVIIGFCIPFLTRLSREDIASILGVFCMSAAFCVLVFSYAAVRDSRIFVFYYGFTLGALSHIIIFGVQKSDSLFRTIRRERGAGSPK